MNQPEDLLNLGHLENLSDYTIFKKKTPAVKRYPNSARKTLTKWYISFVKNNNPCIKYKYWISVNGYLENKNLIQSSPILDIEGPLIIMTSNTKYYLTSDSDVLKNVPHSRFDLTELSKFSNGFPSDWKDIIIHQLTEIFGACRIRSVNTDFEKVLSPFDKLYNDLFNKNKEDKGNLRSEENTKNIAYNNKVENSAISEDIKNARFTEHDDMFKTNENKEFKKLSNEDNIRNTSFNDHVLANSSIRNQITEATVKSQIFKEENYEPSITKSYASMQNRQVESNNLSEEIEILSKSVNNENSTVVKNNNIVEASDIFLEDNIKDIFCTTEKKESINDAEIEEEHKLDQTEVSSISSNQLNKGNRSFDSVMSFINNQKINKNLSKMKSKKNLKDKSLNGDLTFDKKNIDANKTRTDDLSEFFMNSSFNIPDKDKESMNFSKFQDNTVFEPVKSVIENEADRGKIISIDDIKEEDYVQDSHIIESILGLGNSFKNDTFMPNESDKINISLANQLTKNEIDEQSFVGKKGESSDQSFVGKKNKLSEHSSANKKNESSENKSMLEEIMNSRIRKPYSYEGAKTFKVTTPKKKKSAKSEQDSILKKDDNILEKENMSDVNHNSNKLYSKSLALADANLSLTKEIQEIKDMLNVEKSFSKHVSDSEANATTSSLKGSQPTKKKKKSRVSLCMPKKTSSQKKS